MKKLCLFLVMLLCIPVTANAYSIRTHLDVGGTVAADTFYGSGAGLSDITADVTGDHINPASVTADTIYADTGTFTAATVTTTPTQDTDVANKLYVDNNASGAGDTTISVLDSGSLLGEFSAINFDTQLSVTADGDTANVESTASGDGSYDTYVIDVIISPDESDTITHNIGTITPTVVTYSDTEVPYSIVDVPTTIIDSNNIRLDVGGDTYNGKVKVSN